MRIVKTILFFIPAANPNFDKISGDVAEWQLEIDPVDKTPIREIGKDINNRTIAILPWGDDYGYWTDNHLTLDDFKKNFDAINIDKAEFDKNWDLFAKLNPE